MIRRLPIPMLSLLLWLAPLPARSAEDFEDQVDAEPGGRLRIELSSGSVEVEGHDEHRVEVDGRARGFGSEGVRFELEGEGEELRLRAAVGGLAGLFGGPRVRLRVRVPHRYSLDIRTGGGDIGVEELEGEIRARTSGGGMVARRIAGPVDLETSGGSIRADEIQGGLRAHTSGGSITVADVAGRLDARTSGGSLDLRDVSGPVEARTSGGSIRVRFGGAPEGSLETSGGGIEVEFAEGSGAQLDARTSGGRVEIDRGAHVEGRVEASRVEGQLNGGGAPLRLRTSGGNILLRMR